MCKGSTLEVMRLIERVLELLIRLLYAMVAVVVLLISAPLWAIALILDEIGSDDE